MKTVAMIYLAWSLLLSAITFCFYGWDKRQARKNNWRTPESRLHLLSLLGGWPGAMMGRRIFRHKTQKLSFKLVIWLAAILHLILFAAIVYYWFSSAGPATAE